MEDIIIEEVFTEEGITYVEGRMTLEQAQHYE